MEGDEGPRNNVSGRYSKGRVRCIKEDLNDSTRRGIRDLLFRAPKAKEKVKRSGYRHHRE